MVEKRDMGRRRNYNSRRKNKFMKERYRELPSVDDHWIEQCNDHENTVPMDDVVG